MSREGIPVAKKSTAKQRPKLVASLAAQAVSSFSPNTAWDQFDNELGRHRGNDRSRGAAVGVVVFCCLLGLVASFAPQGKVPHEAFSLPAERQSERGVSDDSEEARKVLAGALGTGARHFVRNKMGISELLVQHTYWLDRGDQIEGVVPFAEASLSGRDFLWCNVDFKDLPVRTAVFERTEEGLKLDWESFVHHCQMPLQRFVEEEPNEAYSFRIVMTRDNYYSFAYQDTTKFKCFKLQDALGDTWCWAYCSVDSVAYAAIRALYMSHGKEIEGDHTDFLSKGVVTQEIPKLQLKVILKLKFDPESTGRLRRQALIEELVSESWLVP